MAMAAETRVWTVEEVQALPGDGNRYEVVDGALLVTPAPSLRHQDAVFAIAVRLRAYARSARIGHVAVAPADVTFGARALLQPDVVVFRLVDGHPPATWADAGRPLLAVEVLSPSTAHADRTVKRRLYQREGIPEYWIVDLDSRLVERWRPADERPEVIEERLVWQPESATEPLVVDLPALFAEILEG